MQESEVAASSRAGAALRSGSELVLDVPDEAFEERRYIAEVVFRSFLGLGVQIRRGGSADGLVRIRSAHGTRTLEIVDEFFPSFAKARFHESTLPAADPPTWKVPSELLGSTYSPVLPVLYGRTCEPHGYFRLIGDGAQLGVDVLGAAFMLLTRYEEAVTTSRDSHGRFPWADSILARSGLWRRPLVDEYVELLLRAMQRVWPSVPDQRGRYEVRLSHDVDRLFSVVDSPWRAVLRSAGGDIVRRRRPAMAVRRLAARLCASAGSWKLEPDNTFGLLMKASEKHSLRSAFYFIAGRARTPFEADYELADIRVRKLMRILHARGHEIGLHGSYQSASDPALLSDEFARLREVASTLNIRQPTWGARQHYLRWSLGRTWAALVDAGLAYDSTLGFAERAGFRCGTCRVYPVYDLHRRQVLPLVERPLIAMDVSLLSPQYMGLTEEECLAEVAALSGACRYFGGTFTLLWHNTSLSSRRERRLYEALLEAIE